MSGASSWDVMFGYALTIAVYAFTFARFAVDIAELSPWVIRIIAGGVEAASLAFLTAFATVDVLTVLHTEYPCWITAIGMIGATVAAIGLGVRLATDKAMVACGNHHCGVPGCRWTAAQHRVKLTWTVALSRNRDGSSRTTRTTREMIEGSMCTNTRFVEAIRSAFENSQPLVAALLRLRVCR